jgi:hypothetical protein
MRPNLPVFLLVLVLVGGSFVRLHRLGVPEFLNDELMHYFPAVSLAEGGEPLLPAGWEYLRGSDITRLVSLSLQHGSDPEAAARLPSALLGVFGLFLFALVAWRIAGPWPAVWATLLFAIYPEGVFQSRMVRFYTYQLVFGLLAFYAGWQVVRHAGANTVREKRELLTQWAWLAVCTLAFALALRVQLTTLSIVAGFGTAVAVAAALDLRRRGAKVWRSSVPVAAVAFGLIGAVALLVAAPDLLARLARGATYVAPWAAAEPGSSPLAYYRGLSTDFPLLVALAPLAVIVTLWRDWRLGGYLLLWFGVPLALHSLVFPWRSERYILLAMPALFLIGGIAAAEGSRALYQWLARIAEGSGATHRRARLFAGFGVAAVAVGAVGTQRAFNDTRRMVRASANTLGTNWTAMRFILDSIPGGRELPLGVSDPLAGLFYLGRVDFSIYRHGLARPLPDRYPARSTLAPGRPRELYVGAPVLPTPQDIRAVFGNAADILIEVDRARIAAGAIDPSLVKELERDAEELCEGRCGAMWLYRWTAGREPLSSNR